jgi:hypothetical protein
MAAYNKAAMSVVIAIALEGKDKGRAQCPAIA